MNNPQCPDSPIALSGELMANMDRYMQGATPIPVDVNAQNQQYMPTNVNMPQNKTKTYTATYNSGKNTSDQM